jgi:hypothetical protein
MEFHVSRFDPEADESRPVLGSETTCDGKRCVVRKVEHFMATRLMEMMMAGEEPDHHGHDDVVIVDHPTRPFVKWACWVDVLEGPSSLEAAREEPPLAPG